jgi:hypothetical protein
MLDSILDWSRLTELGADVTAYFILAATGTVLFLIRLGMALFLGDGGDAVDGDMDLDVGGHSDAAFSFFSVLSILAFFMGAGWMGLACRLDWEMGRVGSALLSAGFGGAMMTTASGLTYFTRRLNKESRYDLATAVGKTARVYLTIPEKGKGHGQVEVSVSGRRKIIRASSTGPELVAFSDVEVVSVRDDDSLIVEPKK